MPDDDQLNCAIPQERLFDQTAEPLTVKAIIDRLSRSSSATLTDGERVVLDKFAAATDREAFVVDSFLRGALEHGRTLKTYEHHDADNEDRDTDNEVGWVGLHRFFGMYVVNWTQYGEGEDLYGPFAKEKDAEDFFDHAVAWHTE